MIDIKALIHKQSLIYDNFLKMTLLSESDCTDISTNNCQLLIATVGLNYCKQLRKTDKQYLEYQKKQTLFTPQ